MINFLPLIIIFIVFLTRYLFNNVIFYVSSIVGIIFIIFITVKDIKKESIKNDKTLSYIICLISGILVALSKDNLLESSLVVFLCFLIRALILMLYDSKITSSAKDINKNVSKNINKSVVKENKVKADYKSNSTDTNIKKVAEVDNELLDNIISNKQAEVDDHIAAIINSLQSDIQTSEQKNIDKILNDIEKENSQEHIDKNLQETKNKVNLDALIHTYKPNLIKDKRLKIVFTNTFGRAEKEIDIMSPYLSNSVVNNRLIKLMQNAMSKGIKIKIVYGLSNGQLTNKNESVKEKNSDAMAEYLRKTFKDYGDRFKIVKKNIGGNLLVCDDLYCVMGNGSFLGTPDCLKEKEKVSPCFEDEGFVKNIKKQYFNF